MDPLSGKLLVAAPRLGDPNFKQTVVLVVHHEAEGAFGLVLNRVGDKRVKDVWARHVHEPCPVDQLIMLGGPVEGPLIALHGNATLGEREIVPGVFFTSDRDLLVAVVAEGKTPLRVYSGYSGWGEGQLDGEVASGDWLVASADGELIFADDDGLWRQASRRSADEQLVRSLHVRHVPREPEMN
jgi:putative transcriptional regulator